MLDTEKRKKILERLEGEGLVLDDNPAALARLEYLLERVRSVLAGDVAHELSALFTFRESEQVNEDWQGADGWLWWCSTPQQKFYAIGISSEVLEDTDENYIILVLLHEIAHLLSGQGHNAAFTGCLDKLLAEYNKKTGANIANDYAGIFPYPSTVGRFDSGKKVPRVGVRRRGMWFV